MSEAEIVECLDCRGEPGGENTRVTALHNDGKLTVTWHLPDCTQHTIERILMEDSARQLRRREVWARGAFPAVQARMEDTAAMLPDGQTANAFVAALRELVQAQAEDLGGFVTLPRWSEILERHFPDNSAQAEGSAEADQG